MERHDHREYVTHEECAERRSVLNEHYDLVTRDISKLTGLVNATSLATAKHDQQISMILSVAKWFLGIAGTILGAVGLMIVKGALGL